MISSFPIPVPTLDHSLHDIPLRTLYLLNCSSLPLARQNPKSRIHRGNAFATVKCPAPLQVSGATAQSLVVSMPWNGQPKRPRSLPPTFICSFIRRHLAEDIDLVDFTEILIVLDYLKALEKRRMQEFQAMVEEVIHQGPPGNVGTVSPGDMDVAGKAIWEQSLHHKDTELLNAFSEIDIRLRNWIFFHDLAALSFSRSSSLAMLDTLYPSTSSAIPTADPQRATMPLRARVRNVLSLYIDRVEVHGGATIRNRLCRGDIMGGGPGGWQGLMTALDEYLSAATGFIEECMRGW